MAAVATAPGIPASRFHFDSDSLSTLRDPRSPSDDCTSPGHRSETSSPHPDHNMEVASLSNKLISAINHQTHLDDALAAARQQLESEQERVIRLEALRAEHESLIVTGQLVRREEVDRQANSYNVKLAEERRQKLSVEQDKKAIELELENLTTALFEEANEMVAAARKEREASERRNEQLRTQLKDTEALLASHQEQLAELKGVMSQMNQARDDTEQAAANSTAPSTPALPSQGDIDKAMEAVHLTSTGSVEELRPAPPTTFSNLLSLMLRTNVPAYDDFKLFLEIPRKSAPSSRVNSGSYGGMNTTGPSSALSASIQHVAQASPHSYVGQIGAYATTSPSHSVPTMTTPLKETKFYKRVLTEDIEPTMRLDTAPGLSWLARRTVVNSMCEGSLVVEPMPNSTRTSLLSCSLCGENRKGADFARTYRFRTSESDNAQRYPLCEYCLNRVRATCDCLGFLRMIRDGHWRTESEESEKAAWEESVRLREKMFWARVGGGVVPTFHRDLSSFLPGDSKPATPASAPAVYHHGLHFASSVENERPVTIQQTRDPTEEHSHHTIMGHATDTPRLHAISAARHAATSEQTRLAEVDPNDHLEAHESHTTQARSSAESCGIQSTVAPLGGSASTDNEKQTLSSMPSFESRKSDKSELGMSIPGGFD